MRTRVVTMLALVIGLTATACGSPEPAELSGFVRSPLPVVAGVSLPDAGRGGEPLTMAAADDEVLVVYFGYTSCPDVCPTTMADLRSALGKLDPADARRVDVAMATIDPGRDTDEVITAYVHAFFPEGHGLRTTDDEALRAAADAFGASYTVTTNGAGAVEVSHTGHLYAVDDEGRIQVTWPFGTKSDELAADLRILLGSA